LKPWRWHVPAVECACIGVTDDKTGEAVKLYVVKAPNATLTTADLIAHCRKEMTAYKTPKLVEFLEALPKSNVGKICAANCASGGNGAVRAYRNG